MRRSDLLTSVAAATLVALLAAPALAQTSPAPAQTTYVRGNDGDPETLDQHKTSTVAEAHILRDMYEGLVVNDGAGEVVPGVASTWVISEDGKTYTFTLRDDARWSNGEPVVADDFVYSLKRIMNPATGAKYANLLYPILDAEAVNKGEKPADALGVKAVDAHTLEITLAQPTAYFVELLTHQTGLPVYPKAVEEFGADFLKPENIVTNGPYTLVSFTPNDRLVLQKNANFHDAANVKIERVEFIPFEDRATCLRRFEAGEVQSCSEVPREQIASIKERLGDQLQICPYLGTYYYAINSERPPFDDPRIRRALSLSVDREFLAEKIWSNSMLPAYTLVPPGMKGYVPEEAAPKLDFAETPMLDREDEALKLIEEAGYGPSNPLKLELSFNSSEDHRNTATAIAEMWRPLGIEVTTTVRDLPAHYANLRDAKDYDVARAGWIADYADAQNFLFLNLTNNSGFNYGRYKNPEYDALMARSDAEQDPQKRAAEMAEAEKLFLRDEPQIVLLTYSSTSLVSPRLKGWQCNVRNVHPTRFLSLE